MTQDKAQAAGAVSIDSPRHTLKKMADNEWYFDCEGVYIDVAKDDQGKLSIFVRERGTNAEAFLDQAATPAPAMGEELPPLPKPSNKGMYKDMAGTPSDLFDPAEMHAYGRACMALRQPAQCAAPDEQIKDPITVPRGLLGAACHAIANKKDAPNVLRKLRAFTVGERSAPPAPAAQREAKAAPVGALSDEQYLEILHPVLSRYGMQRYLNGDEITLNPSDYREIIKRAVAAAGNSQWLAAPDSVDAVLVEMQPGGALYQPPSAMTEQKIIQIAASMPVSPWGIGSRRCDAVAFAWEVLKAAQPEQQPVTANLKEIAQAVYDNVTDGYITDPDTDTRDYYAGKLSGATEMKAALFKALEVAPVPAAAPVPLQGWRTSEVEALAKKIYTTYPGADAHPWVEGGNSHKQEAARYEAAARLAAAPVGGGDHG